MATRLATRIATRMATRGRRARMATRIHAPHQLSRRREWRAAGRRRRAAVQLAGATPPSQAARPRARRWKAFSVWRWTTAPRTGSAGSAAPAARAEAELARGRRPRAGAARLRRAPGRAGPGLRRRTLGLRVGAGLGLGLGLGSGPSTASPSPTRWTPLTRAPRRGGRPAAEGWSRDQWPRLDGDEKLQIVANLQRSRAGASPARWVDRCATPPSRRRVAAAPPERAHRCAPRWTPPRGIRPASEKGGDGAAHVPPAAAGRRAAFGRAAGAARRDRLVAPPAAGRRRQIIVAKRGLPRTRLGSSSWPHQRRQRLPPFWGPGRRARAGPLLAHGPVDARCVPQP